MEFDHGSSLLLSERESMRVASICEPETLTSSCFLSSPASNASPQPSEEYVQIDADPSADQVLTESAARDLLPLGFLY